MVTETNAQRKRRENGERCVEIWLVLMGVWERAQNHRNIDDVGIT